MKKIAIIGAGPGGLAAGMLLSKQGYQVDIYEKDAYVGGRSQPLFLGDFKFDTGPTFFMFKEILEEVFEKSGYMLDKEIEFIKLDPLYRLVFNDVVLEPTMDPNENYKMYENYHKGTGDAYLKWRVIQEEKFKRLTPLLKRPFSSLFDYIKKDTFHALPIIGPFKSIYQSLYKLDQTGPFIHSLSFQSKYLGMSSYQAPSAFSFLSYLEHGYGLYHVKGGLNVIHEKMRELIIKNKGNVYVNIPVEKVLVKDKKAYGIKVRGKDLAYDDVVVNADFSYAVNHLFDDRDLRKYKSSKLDKKEYSVSTMNIYLGLDKVFDIAHHEVVFSDDYETYLDNLLKGEFTKDLSYYIHNPSVTDEKMAPKEKSALYILAPIPNLRSDQHWDEYQKEVEQLIYASIKQKLNIDLVPHIVLKKIITPKDWESDYNVHIGAVFNLSHKLNQMMYYRPHNQFEDIKHVYLVGGGTHPGSGLPTIYQSALIVSDLLKKRDDLK